MEHRGENLQHPIAIVDKADGVQLFVMSLQSVVAMRCNIVTQIGGGEGN